MVLVPTDKVDLRGATLTAEGKAWAKKVPLFARVGDAIECEVRSPQPKRIRVQLLTPEACAHANDLLMDAASGWTLVRRQN